MDTQENETYRLPGLKERRVPEACREEIGALLGEIYGYTQFRELEIYDDLFKGKETTTLS